MENSYNNEIEDIMEKEIDAFNSSWNTLNNNCKELEKYSKFIQKYLDIINQYYMSLTELNAVFPNYSSSEFSDFEYDSNKKNFGNIFSLTIQIQLKNLLIFLSQSQSSIHSLNQTIIQSRKFLQNSKKINENIFSNITTLFNNYHKEYLSMINSFENLEKKLIENYIKINYNVGEEINENELKNYVAISKKMKIL